MNCEKLSPVACQIFAKVCHTTQTTVQSAVTRPCAKSQWTAYCHGNWGSCLSRKLPWKKTSRRTIPWVQEWLIATHDAFATQRHPVGNYLVYNLKVSDVLWTIILPLQASELNAIFVTLMAPQPATITFPNNWIVLPEFATGDCGLRQNVFAEGSKVLSPT